MKIHKAEIISIGTELLRGEIVDTNAGFVASQLPLLGVEPSWISTVGDNREQLCQILRQALARSEFIFTTGGLGPTEDDLTRECLATALGEKLVVDAELEKQLRAIFARLGREMPPHNIKQAMLIPSAKPLPNPKGTAPGWWVENEGKIIIALPGPPRELEPMWQDEVKPRLRSRLIGEVSLDRTLKTFGLSEAKVDELVMPLFTSANPSLGIYAKPDGIHLRLIARAENSEKAQKLLETAESQLEKILAHHIWGKDEDSLAGVIGRNLSEKGFTLVTMESCTGGLLADTITNVAGSSQYYRGGLVAYSNEMKVAWGVPAQLIEQYGAVSAEVAEAMAAAAREKLRADFGLSTTGVAGPDSLEGKPPGLVYIGLADSRGKGSWRQNYLPHREEVKRRTAVAALFRLRERVIELP